MDKYRNEGKINLLFGRFSFVARIIEYVYSFQCDAFLMLQVLCFCCSDRSRFSKSATLHDTFAPRTTHKKNHCKRKKTNHTIKLRPKSPMTSTFQQVSFAITPLHLRTTCAVCSAFLCTPHGAHAFGSQLSPIVLKWFFKPISNFHKGCRRSN